MNQPRRRDVILLMIAPPASTNTLIMDRAFERHLDKNKFTKLNHTKVSNQFPYGLPYMNIIHREIVSALIFSKDGGVYTDCWHIPGGGIEEGENKVDALIREIKEETGINISPYKIELADDKGSGESETFWEATHERVVCKMQFYVSNAHHELRVAFIGLNTFLRFIFSVSIIA